MDKKTATEFVERIEAHRAQEEAIWQEMRDRDDYAMHEDKTIKGIIDMRKTARDMTDEANADLGAFDWVENADGDLVPREEIEA